MAIGSSSQILISIIFLLKTNWAHEQLSETVKFYNETQTPITATEMIHYHHSPCDKSKNLFVRRNISARSSNQFHFTPCVVSAVSFGDNLYLFAQITCAPRTTD